jgi:hypothetical protein
MPLNQNKGSIALITLFFVCALAMTSGAILSLSANTYKLSMRNQYRAEAQVVAESELEYIYCSYYTAMNKGASPTNAFNSLTTIADNAAEPTTANVRQPFLQAHQDAGWKVRRSIQSLPSQTGIIPGSTKTGQFNYIIAKIEVIPPSSSSFSNIGTIRFGRRLMSSSATIFQNSIFYQGDLELNPGNDTTITGDISANGSIYMGPKSGKTLTIDGTVRYLTYLNADATHDSGVYYNPNAPAPANVTIVKPTYTKDATIELLERPENLISGIDANAIANSRPDLFGPALNIDTITWTDAERAKAQNNVYRSIIVPPPAVSASSEYPNASVTTADDPGIATCRAYTKSGLIIRIASNNTVNVSQVIDGVTTDVTSQFKAAISDTSQFYDEREGKVVQVNAIDMGKLNTALQTYYPSFNGVLYVNLQNSSPTKPAAIKITNATNLLPATANAPIVGLSVATNGGLYIQGSFNTTPLPNSDANDPHYMPTMLMADTITVLSTNYTDSNKTRTLSARVASLSDAETSAGGMTINAGLLTGNTASTGAIGTSSGGAQNLVRYQENWANQNITFNGSLGCLFQSTQFTQPFSGPGKIYQPPANRDFVYDYNLQNNPPPGNPTFTAFSRGTIFTW